MHQDPGRIYFLAKRIGPSTNIFSIDEQGNLIKHTDSEFWRDFQFSISKEGNLYFVSNRKADHRADINKMRDYFDLFAATSGENTVTPIFQSNDTELKPSISADGKWLAFIRISDESSTSHKLEILELDSDKSTTQTALTAAEILDAKWHPNNRQLAVATYDAGTAQLLLYDMDSKSSKSLVKKTGSSEQISYPVWSPDGKKIAYISHKLGTNERTIYVYDLATEKNLSVSDTNLIVQEAVSWSPDSRHLAYAALQDFHFYYDENTREKVYEGAMHIFLTDGKATTQLTKNPGLHNRPAFSPNGKRIAFIYANGLDQRETALQTMDKDGQNITTLYQPVAGDTTLYWQ